MERQNFLKLDQIREFFPFSDNSFICKNFLKFPYLKLSLWYKRGVAIPIEFTSTSANSWEPNFIHSYSVPKDNMEQQIIFCYSEIPLLLTPKKFGFRRKRDMILKNCPFFCSVIFKDVIVVFQTPLDTFHGHFGISKVNYSWIF